MHLKALSWNEAMIKHHEEVVISLWYKVENSTQVQ